MADLRFNTDRGREVSSTLRNSLNNMQSEIQALNASVQGLVGSAWIAASATQFESEFQTLRSQHDQLANKLQELITRLDSEINEWDATASQLA